MSESELSRALLACEAPLGNDTRQLIGRVLERDRWRVRLLTTLTLFLWLLTAVGVFVWGYLWFSAMQPRLLAKAENRAHIDDSSAWVTIGSAAAKTLYGGDYDDAVGGEQHNLVSIRDAPGDAAAGQRPVGGDQRAIATNPVDVS